MLHAGLLTPLRCGCYDSGRGTADCVDEWTGGNCTHHYMTLGGGPMKMTIDSADKWCTKNSSCHGFTYKTNASGETDIYFRDETQIFFMDSQLQSLTGPLGQSQWTSHVSETRAPPLTKPLCGTDADIGAGRSPGETSCTSGLQIWVKDLGGSSQDDMHGATSAKVVDVALALLLVNHDDEVLSDYSLDVSKLPEYFIRAAGGGNTELSVRDVWAQKTLSTKVGGAAHTPLHFHDVQPHDSVFWVLRPSA